MLLAAVLIAETVLLWAAVPPVGADDRSREPEPRTVVVEVRDHGFHWADAGIGALATAGLGLAGAGATLAIRRGNGRPTRASRTHPGTNEERP